MKGNYLYIVFLLLFSLSFIDCAKRGNPEGGARDTIPPVILKAAPENYSTNFKGNEITIQFDEYIKLKDLQNQLIISPPLDNQPVITPFGTSKTLKIVINDTLKENTTYTINFGSSIVDNNEDNSFDYFKYVFSTGTYIDSLKVLGTITDALNIKPDENVTVMLYEINEQFTDSVIYKSKPFYVASSLSAPGYFSIENIKEGSYLLVGLKDNNSNYKFDPKVDKIGFLDKPISIPEDTTYNINLFKETPDYSMIRLSSSNRQKLQFGYEGNADSVQIELLNTKPSGFKYVITKEKGKDTLNYWFTPKIETDSLSFKVSSRSITDSLSVRLKEEETDSLVVSPLKSGTLLLDEPFIISANNPISAFDKERIQIIDKDSASVDFNTEYDSFHNTMRLLFK
ncbi:Ig-like domain-containing protein, partial [uncultured Planktosalinus sp.]|uniref:Ig-like domain-containing protein n=1 Tax=uncultured Planktosalinus sp. TaxID=1810935 RepID=UPI0030D7A973